MTDLQRGAVRNVPAGEEEGARHSKHAIGIVGMGRMGERHARALLRSGFEIVGWVDPYRADDCSLAPRIEHFDDLVRLVPRLLIATPAATHFELARRALERGADLFVEKPMCSTAFDCARLMDLARHHERRLWVGHSERFHPSMDRLRRALADSPVISLEITRILRSRHTNHASLLEYGVHDFDLAAWLLDEPLRVIDAFGNADQSVVSLVAERTHARVRITCGVARTPGDAARWVRVGTNAKVFFADLLTSRVLEGDTVFGGDAVVDLPPYEEPLLAQARAFRLALDGGSTELATGQDGLRAVAHAERALGVLSGRHARTQPWSGGGQLGSRGEASA